MGTEVQLITTSKLAEQLLVAIRNKLNISTLRPVGETVSTDESVDVDEIGSGWLEKLVDVHGDGAISPALEFRDKVLEILEGESIPRLHGTRIQKAFNGSYRHQFTAAPTWVTWKSRPDPYRHSARSLEPIPRIMLSATGTDPWEVAQNLRVDEYKLFYQLLRAAWNKGDLEGAMDRATLTPRPHHRAILAVSTDVDDSMGRLRRAGADQGAAVTRVNWLPFRSALTLAKKALVTVTEPIGLHLPAGSKVYTATTWVRMALDTSLIEAVRSDA